MSPFQVAVADGSVVGPAPIYCILIPVPPAELPPGDELTMIQQWNGHGSSEGLLPAGTYLLRGRVYADRENDPVTGPPTAITIRD